MKKTILVTGSTDGIGFATARSLLQLGHTVLIHGRSEKKITAAKEALSEFSSGIDIETYQADLSVMADVKTMAQAIIEKHDKLDALINNAGVFIVPNTPSVDGLDVRFAVNTIAPYLLTQLLMPLLSSSSRVVNLSSAAQTSVQPAEIAKPSILSDSAVYAKSKLALTMWSRQMAMKLGTQGPAIIAINPKSFLGSKMVKDAYGVAGGDLQIGADILVKAALSKEFSQASGKYFDNDIGRFSSPHPDALDNAKIEKMAQAIEAIIA